MFAISQMVMYAVLAIPLAFSACAGHMTASTVPAPGEEVSAKIVLLKTGGDAALQQAADRRVDHVFGRIPLCNGRIQGQVESPPFLLVFNEDLTQCVIYEGNTGDARLIGKPLFEALPPEEKSL